MITRQEWLASLLKTIADFDADWTAQQRKHGLTDYPETLSSREEWENRFIEFVEWDVMNKRRNNSE